jgi:hypothetical protein
MAWSTVDAKKLVTMWKEGKRIREISKALGGLTKSAIVGKVHRLGLSNRGDLTERNYTVAMNELDMCLTTREMLLAKRRIAYDKIKTTDAIPSQIIQVKEYLNLLEEIERLRGAVTELAGEKFSEIQAKREQQSNDWTDGRAPDGFPTRQDGLPHRDS